MIICGLSNLLSIVSSSSSRASDSSLAIDYRPYIYICMTKALALLLLLVLIGNYILYLLLCVKYKYKTRRVSISARLTVISNPNIYQVISAFSSITDYHNINHFWRSISHLHK